MKDTIESPLFYYPYLDGLRFVAFLAVFIHHSPVLAPSPFWRTLHQYGWMGVDLFLCLSAFLFTKLLFMEYQTLDNIQIKEFYIRRILRIWPLYYFFTSIMLIVSLERLGGWSPILAQRTIGIATFTDNILSAIHSKYTPLFASAHLWTISYEEQFYAVIPLFLRKLFKMAWSTKVFVIAALFFVGSLMRVSLIYFNIPHPAIWVLPFTHFESILGGIIVGLGLFDEYFNKIPSWPLFFGGIISFILVSQLPDVYIIDWELMLTYPLVGVGMSTVLYSFTKKQDWAVKRALQNKFIAYLGKISYGLYVYHLLGLSKWNILTFGLHFSPKPLLVFCSGLIITIVTSIISYELLEKPFLRLKKRFTTIQTRPI